MVLSVEKAKKSIIAQIKRKGGLFENCGRKELQKMEYFSEEWKELSQWIDSLDYSSVQQYLK